MKDYEILLVDDEEIVLTGLSRKLETDGYRVKTARSGSEAIDAMCTRKFDLVLTDLVMDNTDGIAVLKKAKDVNPDTIVIILTAHGDMRSAIEALRLHADDYMLKSYGAEEICIKIARWIEQLELKRKIHIYESLLPICCVCKMVRDDTGKGKGEGSWMKINEYIQKKSGIDLTHTFCPECAKTFQNEMT